MLLFLSVQEVPRVECQPTESTAVTQLDEDNPDSLQAVTDDASVNRTE